MGYTLAMTLDALIMLAGTLVAVLPFLGFPQSWNTIFFFLLGILVIALGIILRRRRSQKRQTRNGSTFSESSPEHDEMAD